ncbi:MAG: hypothetical protein K6G81_12065 [Lachnospiraceae bacterium]|nr:hypothetical protein [Lachnospiraceae bacterium]
MKETNKEQQSSGSENLSYAEKLRREEEEDRAMVEQRMNAGPKTGCLGMSATFLIGVACLIFLIAGLGFVGYGITTAVDGGAVKDVITQIAVGIGVTAVTVAVWIIFRKSTKE